MEILLLYIMGTLDIQIYKYTHTYKFLYVCPLLVKMAGWIFTNYISIIVWKFFLARLLLSGPLAREGRHLLMTFLLVCLLLLAFLGYWLQLGNMKQKENPWNSQYYLSLYLPTLIGRPSSLIFLILLMVVLYIIPALLVVFCGWTRYVYSIFPELEVPKVNTVPTFKSNFY